MYLILWLLLKHTSQAPAGVALGDHQGGHVPDPLAIIEGHQPGPAGVALGDPQGAMYLILWLLLKHTS